MTIDCPEASLIPFQPLLRWPPTYHFYLVEGGDLGCLLEMLLKNVLTLHMRTYSHDIALVDQGGARPTFGCVFNV